MRAFQTRICPLCSKSLKNKTLKVNNVLSNTDYFCEEFYLRESNNFDDLFMLLDADYSGPYMHESHYSVKNDYGSYTQVTIIPPFIMETLENPENPTTKIFKFPFKNQKELIMEIPAIYPEDYLPARLIEKIKNLILFS